MLRKSYGVFLLLLALLVFSFGVQADFTITDDLGCQVSLEEKPQRIISLNPAMTELLFALELDEEVVGVTNFVDYPEAALEKEKIGSIIEPNMEKILALEPDLVLAMNINKLETVEQLKKLGITVAGFDPTTVDDIIVTIKKLGKLTGREEKAQEIVTELYLDIAAIQELVKRELATQERPKVFYEIWHDPLYTAGANTYIDDLINLAGGINIGREAKGSWPQYSLEKLILENPDVYISGSHSAPQLTTPESIKERQNYQSLKAVQNDRVYIVDADLVSRPTPRIILGLKEFVKAIFPHLAEEVDKI